VLLLLAAIAAVAVPGVRPLPAPSVRVGERSAAAGRTAAAASRRHEARAVDVSSFAVVPDGSLAAPWSSPLRGGRTLPGFPFALRQRPPPPPALS
jgi:hypothetical protein